MLSTPVRAAAVHCAARPTVRATLETIPSTAITILRAVEAVRAFRRPLAAAGRRMGFVPTMGALHAGHLALIRRAARENDDVVVSIYINPAQFGPREDFASYPIAWASDKAALARLDSELAAGQGGRIAAVFAPPTTELYPYGFPGQEVQSGGCFVTITPLSGRLEGGPRPTFFRGVATVCMKLFNIVQPDRVYFGQKDVQQSVVIRRMVRDLMVPTEVVVCPTEREPDGLALSSRNVYLGTRRRSVALVIHTALCAAESAYQAGTMDRSAILGAAWEVCDSVLQEQKELPPNQRVFFEVDYISLADPDAMDEVERIDPARGAIISAAVKMLPLEEVREGEDVGHAGGPQVRLLDNIILPARHSESSQHESQHESQQEV